MLDCDVPKGLLIRLRGCKKKKNIKGFDGTGIQNLSSPQKKKEKKKEKKKDIRNLSRYMKFKYNKIYYYIVAESSNLFGRVFIKFICGGVFLITLG